jgi:hypothetical protein
MGTVESGVKEIQGQWREPPRAYGIGMSGLVGVAVEAYARRQSHAEEALRAIPSAHNTYHHTELPAASVSEGEEKER